MQNAITTLRIRNFKSIKDVTLAPRRVNLIIGEPNVGKSNVLEAMSLLGGKFPQKNDSFAANDGIIRYYEVRQLFYDNLFQNTIIIESNTNVCLLGLSHDKRNEFTFLVSQDVTWQKFLKEGFHAGENGDLDDEDAADAMFLFSDWALKERNPSEMRRILRSYVLNNLTPSGSLVENAPSKTNLNERFARTQLVRPYVFRPPPRTMEESGFSFLQSPFGKNLVSVIQNNSNLRKEISNLFAKYGLKMLLRVDESRLEIIKDLDGVVYAYPYVNSADTLQRLIFYLAAIESNDDAVILFEEPEAHSYPVYVAQLGRRIAESRNNQFFVATHSPYLITEILETMLPDEEQAQEVAIFVAYYEDYQTKLRQLTDAEVRGIRADSLDVFYNMDRLVRPQA